MNRMPLVAIAACSAALALVGCDRSRDQASETKLTSAAPEAEARDGGVQSQVGHSGHAAYDTALDDAHDRRSALSDVAAANERGHDAGDTSGLSTNTHPTPSPTTGTKGRGVGRPAAGQ